MTNQIKKGYVMKCITIRPELYQKIIDYAYTERITLREAVELIVGDFMKGKKLIRKPEED